MSKFLYIFLDEGGNFDFSLTGTKYFTLTSVTKFRPFNISPGLDNLKHQLLEGGLDIEYFHATYDSWPTRNEVFNLINRHISDIQIDSLIVEKRKTGPSLQKEIEFYSRMLGYLLRYVIQRVDFSIICEVIVITDAIPINRKRKAIEKAVKLQLRSMLPTTTPFRLMHHMSRSSYGLQISDYCNWAIYRKWDRGDDSAYRRIEPAIKSEFDIFKTGTTYYY